MLRIPRLVLAWLCVALLCSLAVAPVHAVGPEDYIVAEGDTLFTIAEKLLGDSLRYGEIVQATNARHATDPSYALIEDPTAIRVGWKLVIVYGFTPSRSSRLVMPAIIRDSVPSTERPKGNLKFVQKLDDYTVKFGFYRYPQAFLVQLATPMMSLSSPVAVQTWGRDYLYHPVGTGPYLFRAWTLGDRVVLDANPDYWGEKPKINRLVYRVVDNPALRVPELLTGTVDFLYRLRPEEVAAVRAAPNLVMRRVPPLNVGFMTINLDWQDAQGNKVFQDLRVRQALAHAINKEAIVRDLYPSTGVVAQSFVPPVLWGYNQDVPDYNYNPERARQLLSEAGYAQGFKTQLWAMSVPRSYLPDPLKVAQYIQADLQAVGIQAEIVTHEWGEYLAKIDAGEHALALLGWVPDVPDPDDYLFALFGSATKQWAASGPPDQRLYEMLLRARVEGDLQVRQQLYYEANAIIHGLVPGVPLMHQGVLSASRPGLVGYSPAPQFDQWRVASYVTDTLTIGNSNDVQGLDVADETDAESLAVGAQLYEGLVAFEPGTTRIVPALAERWEVSRDGLEWTFTLRRGVKFHDGSDFNADAVLFNIDRIWDRNHPYRAGHTGAFSYFAWFLGGFKGEAEPQPTPTPTP